MKRNIPLLITFIAGFIILISEFIPHYPFGSIKSGLEGWFLIISSFAIILGNLNLIKVNILKIKFKSENWKYSYVTLISFTIMLLAGAFWGTQTKSGMFGSGSGIIAQIGAKPFDYLYNNVYQHLSATMFSLLSFYIASAAYRAFIGRTIEAKLLVFSAIIVMLGNTSLGFLITSGLPHSLDFLQLPNISEYIMKYPNTAGQRAIMMGAGLGIIGSSLRIILGIERSYLGGE